MKAFTIFLICLLLMPSKLTEYSSLKLYIFNVGQGSWAVLVDAKHCYHFDSGGEQNPMQKIKRLCFDKQNAILISHFDLDHVSFVFSLKRNLGQVCRMEISNQPHKKLKQILNELPPCSFSKPEWLKTLYHPSPENVVGKKMSPSKASFPKAFSTHSSSSFTHSSIFPNHSVTDPSDANINANHYSMVWQIDKKVIIAGDSTCEDEPMWISKISHQVSTLVLGHHGSQGSTCMPLLNHLPRLITAVASARKQKYGHPHIQTLLRLKTKGLSPLRTEDWGTIELSL